MKTMRILKPVSTRFLQMTTIILIIVRRRLQCDWW